MSSSKRRVKWPTIKPSRLTAKKDERSLSMRILTLVLLGIILAFTLESFNRHSVLGAFKFIGSSPLIFLLNVLLITNTLAVSVLFRSQIAILVMVTMLWLTLAIVNFVVTSFRTQPFTLADVMLAKDMFSLITFYFKWYEIGLMVLGIITLIGTIVFMFRKAPKLEKVKYLFAVIAFAAITGLSIGLVQLGIHADFLETRFQTLKYAYQHYGFGYTFINTFADLGISKPDEYSPEAVDEIVEETESEKNAKDKMAIKPNIIYVQLESFMDADSLSDEFQFSESYSPNFHKLLTENPSGKLFVPVVGGGTANTEFEMLTGMNLDFFGAGEYPYYTVMRDMTCESICHVLNRHGYTSTAIHNYMATFYGRNIVYPNLGFNRFESEEYMNELSYGEVGWAYDDGLIDSVITAMDSTEGRDFITTITVSTHGKYPFDRLLNCAQDGIQVLSTDEYVNATQLQNYINLAIELDNFIGDFLKAMEKYPEPVVCVFYGDHLPAIEWENTSVKSGNLYETQYCIWTNYGRDFEVHDSQAYRVSANLLKQLGIEDGVVFKFHQANTDLDESDEYLAALEMLQYDMLYGEREAYDVENPIEPTELQLGLHEIKIEKAECRYKRLMLTGEGFNEYSHIVIDNEVYETIYIDSNHLATHMKRLPAEAQEICVAQLSTENVELTRTEPFPAAEVTGKGRQDPDESAD